MKLSIEDRNSSAMEDYYEMREQNIYSGARDLGIKHRANGVANVTKYSKRKGWSVKKGHLPSAIVSCGEIMTWCAKYNAGYCANDGEPATFTLAGL